jgi:hypothetical protein
MSDRSTSRVTRVIVVASVAFTAAWLGVRRADPVATPPRPQADNVPEGESAPWLGQVQARQAALDGGADRGPLRCRVIPSPKKAGGGGTPDTQVEFTNVSGSPAGFDFPRSPLDRVCFLVRGRDGRVLHRFDHGLCVSMLTSPWSAQTVPRQRLTLAPGQTIACPLHLVVLRACKREPLVPGRYGFEAVLLHGEDLLARSPRLVLKVEPVRDDSGRVAWDLIDEAEADK